MYAFDTHSLVQFDYSENVACNKQQQHSRVAAERTNERTVCAHGTMLWHVNAFKQPFCQCICSTHNAVITSMGLWVYRLAMEWKRNVYLSECVIHIRFFFWCTICRLFFVQKWIKCIEEYTVFILLLVLSITCLVLRTKGMLPIIFGCFILFFFFVRCNHNRTVVEIWNFVATKLFPNQKNNILNWIHVQHTILLCPSHYVCHSLEF